MFEGVLDGNVDLQRKSIGEKTMEALRFIG